MSRSQRTIQASGLGPARASAGDASQRAGAHDRRQKLCRTLTNEYMYTIITYEHCILTNHHTTILDATLLPPLC